MACAKESIGTPIASSTEPNLARAPRPLCFVISPIGEEGSVARKTSDKVLKHIITKPLEDKYRIERADEISKPGLITVQIIQRLRDAELVIADLSGGNPNVYYELAIRHYLAKPVVHIIAVGQEAPFDVDQMRYVRFDIQDPDSIEAAQKELLAHVEALEQGEKVVTLIQVANILSETGAGGEKTEILDVLGALYAAFGNLQQELMETKQFARAMYYESPARSERPFSLHFLSSLAPETKLSSLVGGGSTGRLGIHRSAREMGWVGGPGGAPRSSKDVMSAGTGGASQSSSKETKPPGESTLAGGTNDKKTEE